MVSGTNFHPRTLTGWCHRCRACEITIPKHPWWLASRPQSAKLVQLARYTLNVPDSPSIIILAGPNGAGKTTAARLLLADAVDEFVNADDIARGLSGFAPQRSAFSAGRLMLERIHALADQRATFAFETTLASRTFAPWLANLRATGYHLGLLFLSIHDPDTCIARVRQRVAEGGHDVPPEVIRRRHARGLQNLFNLYLPLLDA